jgi:hypothetical protein
VAPVVEGFITVRCPDKIGESGLPRRIGLGQRMYCRYGMTGK